METIMLCVIGLLVGFGIFVLIVDPIPDPDVNNR